MEKELPMTTSCELFINLKSCQNPDRMLLIDAKNQVFFPSKYMTHPIWF